MTFIKPGNSIVHNASLWVHAQGTALTQSACELSLSWLSSGYTGIAGKTAVQWYVEMMSGWSMDLSVCVHVCVCMCVCVVVAAIDLVVGVRWSPPVGGPQMCVCVAAVDMAVGLCRNPPGLAAHGGLECEHLQAHQQGRGGEAGQVPLCLQSGCRVHD